MGHAKTIDDADLQEVLSVREDFGVHQKDNTLMNSQVSKLQEDVQSVSSKQGEIYVQVGGVEKVVLELGKQLSGISIVLQTIVEPGSTIQNGGIGLVLAKWFAHLHCSMNKCEINMLEMKCSENS